MSVAHPHPIYTISITGPGRYYVSAIPFGSVDFIVLEASGLSMTLEATNDREKFTDVPYLVDGVAKAQGSILTPTAPAVDPYQWVRAALGNLGELCLNVSVGTGKVSARAGDAAVIGQSVSLDPTTITALKALNASARITTATTTTVLGAPGVLDSVVIETVTTGTITVYDNSVGSGTIVAIIPIGAAIGSVFKFDRQMSNGITVVTSAADRCVVNYRQ